MTVLGIVDGHALEIIVGCPFYCKFYLKIAREVYNIIIQAIHTTQEYTK